MTVESQEHPAFSNSGGQYPWACGPGEQAVDNYLNVGRWVDVSNNSWETNDKSDQVGPHALHCALWPRGPFDATAAARWGIERSQSLLAAARRGYRFARSIE